MERRRYLHWLGILAAGGLAGCSEVPTLGSEGTASSDTASRVTPSTPAFAAADIELPVPKSQFVLAGVKDSIPAITEPAFADDWSDVHLPLRQDYISPDFDFQFEPRLSADTAIIGVERHGTARAYPLGVLNWFEVVNDEFPAANGGHEPVLVTYCPLCRTGLTAKRLVQDEPSMFGVSGLLYRDNLVMYDEATRSLWSQVRAQAIRGPMTGTRLALLPSTLTTWSKWRASHPNSKVLLPPPISKTVTGAEVRDVTKSPYGNYENTTQIGVALRQLADDPLHPKAIVIGIRSDAEVRAYPLKAVRKAGGVVNDTVGEKPVVIAAADTTVVAYDRRVGGMARTFESTAEDHLEAAGSRWEISTGQAVDGPFEGEELRPATAFSAMYWFAWWQFNPETEIWSAES